MKSSNSYSLSLFKLSLFYNMTSISAKMENRDRNGFRVKFTGNEKKKANTGKEMILGGRTRTVRDFNNFATTNMGSYDTEEECIEDDSNTSKRQLKPELITPKIIEYKEINTSVITTQLDVLRSFFEYDISLKLVFRASNHQFSVKEFHRLCDGLEDTVTLCLTEDNKVIGGYTPLSWEDQFHRNSTHFKTDFKRETFIFSISDKAKYPLVKSLKNKAICCFKGYGPTFGGGYDLLIGDKSNEQPNTTSYFPRNFQHPNMNKFNKRDFTGTSRKNFKLQEWEVFQLIKLNSCRTVQNCNFGNSKEDDEDANKPGLIERIKNAAKNFFSSLLSDS